MKITKREAGPVVVLDAQGDFCLLEVSKAREHFKELLANGARGVVLNMTEVTKIDSSGIGALVDFQKRLKANGGHLALFKINKHIRDIMELTNIITFFDIFDVESEALSAVQT